MGKYKKKLNLHQLIIKQLPRLFEMLGTVLGRIYNSEQDKPSVFALTKLSVQLEKWKIIYFSTMW